MIEVRDVLRCAGRSAWPQLSCRDEWYAFDGRGVVAGLLDTAFDERHPDLAGADLIVRDFADAFTAGPSQRRHGTYSVTAFVGQGVSQVRGIAPRATLLVAAVVAADGSADPDALARGLNWLVESGAQVVAVPLGGRLEDERISASLRLAEDANVVVLAPIGSGWSQQSLFPARHPSVIAVGAADPAGSTWFEPARVERLDLLAPGWNVTAAISATELGAESGSSCACVIASAVAVLGLAARALGRQQINRSAVLRMLRHPADARRGLSGEEMSHGEV